LARVRLADGTEIQARGVDELILTDADLTPTYGLYLDERWRKRDILWQHTFIDWPDFGVPPDEPALFEAIVEAWERATRGDIVEVACRGGIGRTGTVVACMAILSGVPSSGAVDWTRAQYDARAVETDTQEELVARFGEWHELRAG
jgi:protein-tyrosine phosphatase